MKRVACLFLFLLFFLFILARPAYSLGISPAKITMNFVPGYEQEFDGTVSNSLDEPREVDLYVDPNGDIAQYFTITTEDHLIIEPHSFQAFKFKIKLPENIEEPGTHTSILWAEEYVAPQPGVAIAKVRVGIKTEVMVPYPGKYAGIWLDIKNANVNDTVIFEAYIVNQGKENIEKAWGEIKVMYEDNRTIDIMQLESKPVATTARETFRATWFSNVEAGLYKAQLTIYYDDKTAKHIKEFNLGAPLIKIVNVTAESVVNGSIGKVYTKIKSYWNQEITGAYLELFVKDAKGNDLSYHKSESITVAAFDTPVVISYLDASRGIEPGKYTAVAVLHYLDKNDTMETGVEILNKPGFALSFELIVFIAGVAGAAVIITLIVLKRKKTGSKQKQTKLV
ncbi:MAG: hypothetical protein NTU57_04895 [Candidatus Aenigmarchaeota archaeon]|nr:hypothetical protein [Candidatus Aenigmarchaeota archaeon]